MPDLLAICRRWHPNLVVREVSEFGGCVVAERLGLPHAAVLVSAYRPHLHEVIAAPLNRLRADVGLPPDPDRAMLYRYLLLTPVPPSFQDPGRPLPPTARAVQSAPFDREDDAGLPAWVGALPSRPTGYASLGPAYNCTPGIVAAILSGLHNEPVNLIVTVGEKDPANFGPQLPGVRIERCIPQSLIFPRCALVITHGGFSTVMTALDHGLPMDVIPIAADQPDNPRRAAALGLARVIPPHQRKPDAIRDAMCAVLNEPLYRRSAERLRDEFHVLPGLGYALELLERLGEERRPLAASSGRSGEGASDDALAAPRTARRMVSPGTPVLPLIPYETCRRDTAGVTWFGSSWRCSSSPSRTDRWRRSR